MRSLFSLLLAEALARDVFLLSFNESASHISLHLMSEAGRAEWQGATQASLRALKAFIKAEIGIEATPQPAWLTYAAAGGPLSLRLVCYPTLNGERLNLSIQSSVRPLADLVPSNETCDAIRAAVDAPGALLVVGPLGAGRHSLCEALLTEQVESGRAVMMIGDDIEALPGATLLVPSGGYAASIKEGLRADPDLLFVEQIREPSTAEAFLQASCAQSRALGICNTYDTAGTLRRLFEMGVTPILVASAVRAVLTMRRTRRLCQACRVRALRGYRAREGGCGACFGWGYRGGVSYVHLWQPTDEHRRLLLAHSLDELQRSIEPAEQARLEDARLLLVALGLCDEKPQTPDL